MLTTALLVYQLTVGLNVKCTDCKSLTGSIIITGQVQSTIALSIESEPLGLDGAYAMNVKASYMHAPGAQTTKQRYVVFDEGDLVVATNNGDIEFKGDKSLVIAWPEKYKLPGKQALLAIARAYKVNKEAVEIRVARIQQRLVIRG